MKTKYGSYLSVKSPEVTKYAKVWDKRFVISADFGFASNSLSPSVTLIIEMPDVRCHSSISVKWSQYRDTSLLLTLPNLAPQRTIMHTLQMCRGLQACT